MAIPAKLLDGIDRLEPLPLTLQRLLILLQNDDYPMKEVIATIERDQAITATILRMANSPAYGGRVRIRHLRDAIVRLGTATLLGIALGSHMRGIKTAAPMYALAEDDLWLHAVAASLAVKAIIAETGNRGIPPLAQIAALLHDIGKLIMVRYLAADVGSILELCKRKNVCFVDAETELFGCNHAEVGGAMARKWQFPEEVVLGIEAHHEVPQEHPHPVIDAVMMANLVAKSIGVGLGAEGFNLKADTCHQCERLGLSLEGLERVCAQTFIWLDEVKAEYSLA